MQTVFVSERTGQQEIPTLPEVRDRLRAAMPVKEQGRLGAAVHRFLLNTCGLPFFYCLHALLPVIRFLHLEWIPLYFSRRWVAGTTTRDAIRAVKRLKSQGLQYVLDILGEAVTTDEAANRAMHEYEALLAKLSDEMTSRKISIKLSQLGLALDEDRCLIRMRHLLEYAVMHEAIVTIDMEQYALKDATIRIFAALLEDYNNVGICLQAYLKDTRADLHYLMRIAAKYGRELHIRLCKGAYLNQETKWAQEGKYALPLFTTKEETTENYLALAEEMLGNRDIIYSAFATHDEETIAKIVHGAEEQRISSKRFEFQLLYGIRTDLALALVNLGFHTRIYVPFGSECLPYVIRRMVKNPVHLELLKKH